MDELLIQFDDDDSENDQAFSLGNDLISWEGVDDDIRVFPCDSEIVVLDEDDDEDPDSGSIVRIPTKPKQPFGSVRLFPPVDVADLHDPGEPGA